MKVIYLLGCIAVLAIWSKAVMNEVKEKGKLDVTVGDVLNLLLLTICSWCSKGFACQQHGGVLQQGHLHF